MTKMNNMTKYRIIHHALECEPELSEHYFISGCLISLEPLQDDQKIIEEGLERLSPKPEDEKCKHKWLDEPNYQCIYCGSLPTREEKENLRDPVGCSCTKEQKEERKKALAPSSPQWEEELKEFRRKYEGANYWTTVSTPMIEDMLKDIRTLLEKTREEEKKKWHDVAHDEYARGQADSYEICADIAKQSLLAKLKENVERMKNVNEMVKMDGQKYTMGYEKARKDILKLIKTLE